MITDTMKRYIRLHHVIYTFITAHMFIETVHNSIPMVDIGHLVYSKYIIPITRSYISKNETSAPYTWRCLQF